MNLPLLLLLAQFVPFPSPHNTLGGSLVAHTVRSQDASTVTCTGVTTVSCTASVSIVTSGNAIGVVFAVAMDASLVVGCSRITVQPTMSDGTNTYTLRAGPPDTVGGNFCAYGFTAKNVTSGSYTLTIAFTASPAIVPSYLRMDFVEIAGMSTTAEADTNLSKSTGGTATTAPSITSPGNVSGSGEVALALAGWGTFSSCGAGWSLLDSIATATTYVCYQLNPTPGGTLNITMTQSSHTWNGVMIGLKP